ncbi:MAG TPA: acyl-CoA thioesterase II [Steroidobacter sp.]|nr:acyl-CoA thioesterase II [Steroidobacter sp.]
MDPLLTDVLQVLRLERLELDLFRGESRDPGHHRVFGGQVLGQALMAAYATVQERAVHSLHAYFLRAGDPELPIVYEVDRSREGRSFSSRRVVAIQRGEQIFHMSASFQASEQAADRQGRMPQAPGPEDVPDLLEAVETLKKLSPERAAPLCVHTTAFEFRAAELPDPRAEIPSQPRMKIWFRAADRLPDDEPLHRCLLAYASDFYLLSAAVLDASLVLGRSSLRIASIDHAMWFHRPARADEWLLYAMDSPTASGSRGFARGEIWTQDGRLVASTAQEGLVRIGKRPADGGPSG